MSRYKPVTLDNLPPDVDRNQCLTAEEFYQRPLDFSLTANLVKYAGSPPFPSNTNIRQVQLFVDERLGFSWAEGVITFQLYLPSNFQMRTFCGTINGEMAYIQSGDEVLLDRTQYINLQSVLSKSNYMAMES